jgi:hypothetical protein
MRRDGQDVPVLAARARSECAWSMRAVWNILAAAPVIECVEEMC